jgi:YwiC-like protein
MVTNTMKATSTTQQARARALIVPREHGAWGLLLIPLFTGVAAGLAPRYHVGSLLVFTVGALALFWLRTPVESLLGTAAIKAHTSQERRTALLTSAVLIVVSGACLAGLMWNGKNLQILLLGTVAALAFAIQALLRRLGRQARMAAQLVGVIGLTCAAPAAYYIGAGRLDERSLVLWAANWAFAANQIHFVQLRIHAARAANFSEKFAQGRSFFLAQIVLLVVLILSVVLQAAPALTIIAFVPMIIRGTQWFFRKPEPLDVKRLGWSEMKQGVLFGILLAIAFICS